MTIVPPESVLIIRMSAIGDVIHALPALDLLRQLLPKARIGWLVEELGAPLLMHHPHIDKLYVIPRKRWRKNFRKMLFPEIMPFYRKIRADRWDASLDFQGISKSGISAWACGAKRRVGFAGENSREVNALFNHVRVAPKPGDHHVVQQNIRQLEALGLRIPEQLPRGTIRLLPEEVDAMRAKLQEVNWRGEKLLAINPGAGFITKRWQPENFAKLAKALIALETYVSGLADLIIDYASARLDDEPFSTSPTEDAMQWLLHRRMGAQQQMRWSPRGAHLMLQVRTASINGTLEADHGSMSLRRRSSRLAA